MNLDFTGFLLILAFFSVFGLWKLFEIAYWVFSNISFTG